MMHFFYSARIKEVTNKTTNKTQLPELFKLDGKIITYKIDIANQFNTFFTNIGPSLASKITTDGNKTYKSLLNERSAHEFTFNKITEVDVLNIIDKLYHQRQVVAWMEYLQLY